MKSDFWATVVACIITFVIAFIVWLLYGKPTITDNTASGNGGGVYVNPSSEGVTPSFTMTGGAISGNKSGGYGGGISNLSVFTVTGGEISNNQITGTSNCGGGAIASFNDFTLGKDAYIPAGSTGKNDIYKYGLYRTDQGCP